MVIAVLIVVAAVSLAAAIIILKRQSTAKPPVGRPTASLTSSGLTENLLHSAELNTPLLELSFTKADGSKVELSQLRGRVVVLLFWASFCPYCQNELKNSAGFAALAGDGVSVYLVDKLDGKKETQKNAEAYLKSHGITLPPLYDKGLAAYDRLGIHTIPTVLVIDPSGVLRAVSTSDSLSPSALGSMIDDARYGGAAGVRGFISRGLTGPDGGVRTNYGSGDGTTPSGTDVLSESEGLMLEYAAGVHDTGLFKSTLGYVDKNMLKNPLAAWVVTAGGPSDTNAALDDLRIYGALSAADGLWGGYTETLSRYRDAIYTYNTSDGRLVNSYDFASGKKSDELSLAYADFKTLGLMAKEDPRFKDVYNNGLATVQKGLISRSFPLYYSSYDYSAKKYSSDPLNMSEELETLLHLAEVGKLPPESLAWLKTAVDGEGLFMRYNVDGSVPQGYRGESTAVYGLASLIGDAAGDHELAAKALERMQDRRIFDSSSVLDGAFGNTDGSGIYSFDQCVALLAYSDFEKAGEP